MRRHLVWFRNDLRTTDHPALHGAAQGAHVTAVYLLTPVQWQQHGLSDFKIALILRSVDRLSEQLSQLGISLQICTAKDFVQAPEAILKCAQSLGADALFFNEEVAINESRRDKAVAQVMQHAGIRVETFSSQTSMPPGSVVKPDGSPYSVFTPFKKRWLADYRPDHIDPLPAPKPQGPQPSPSATPQRVGDMDKSIGEQLWKAGQTAAMTLLKSFIKTRIQSYQASRDFPAQRGTSVLSPHLAIGTISPRQCLHAAHAANGGRLVGASEGINTWVSELIWREFYSHILAAYPKLAMGHAFKTETDSLPWGTDQEALERWQRGETGLPLVDAGMRQLNTTGWMHNRLRMVTATFLAKQLFLDWRLGEAYFMRQLVDGELAANNGGWQWSASTGTDAVPYFRIFNPVRQAERFDPSGDFVRSMVPELADLPTRHIFEPWRHGGAAGYPSPMVDLSEARQKTLAIWKQGRLLAEDG